MKSPPKHLPNILLINSLHFELNKLSPLWYSGGEICIPIRGPLSSGLTVSCRSSAPASAPAPAPAHAPAVLQMEIWQGTPLVPPSQPLPTPTLLLLLLLVAGAGAGPGTVGVFVSLLFRTLSLSLSSLPLLAQSQKKALLRGWPRLSFCERPEHRQL